MIFPLLCSSGSRQESSGILCTSGGQANLSIGCFYIWEIFLLLLNINIEKATEKKKKIALQNHFRVLSQSGTFNSKLDY